MAKKLLLCASTFHISAALWSGRRLVGCRGFEDDDAGLARTMAALDRRLRRGQQTLDGLEQFGTAFFRFGAAMQDIVRGATQGRPRKEAGPDTHTP